jgi:hypothetical protein
MTGDRSTLAFTLGIAFSLWVVAMASGCGTIVYGTKQTVPINSTPAGVTVTLPTGEKVTTPARVSLRRSKEQLLVFELEGYDSERVVLRRHFNIIASLLGNILCLSCGILMDALSGGIWSFEPNEVNVEMVKAEAKQGS